MDNDHLEWRQNLFNALTSQTISRNKHFAAFSSVGSKQVLKRFRTICALMKETERLAEIPGTRCWTSASDMGLTFHLDCPPLQYRRSVALYHYEWEWLGRQSSVQTLLSAKPLEA